MARSHTGSRPTRSLGSSSCRSSLLHPTGLHMLLLLREVPEAVGDARQGLASGRSAWFKVRGRGSIMILPADMADGASCEKSQRKLRVGVTLLPREVAEAVGDVRQRSSSGRYTSSETLAWGSMIILPAEMVG